MQTQWALQDAKAKFSQVIKQAESDGPQEITRHGQTVAVIIEAKEFDHITGREGGLVDFLTNSPLGEVDLDIERNKDTGRVVDL